MQDEKQRSDRMRHMAERMRQRSYRPPAVEEDLPEEDRSDAMHDSSGVKKRQKGLTVFGDTGGVGNEAVQIMPRLPGDPEEPPYLDATAQAEWHRMVKILRDLGILSPAYAPSLGLYCQQFSRLCEAEAMIAQNGLVVSRSHGIKVISPYVSISRQSTLICQRLLASFGLTPESARNVATPPQADALEEFLKHA